MKPEHLTQKEIYEMLRAQIEHEDQLIDRRVNLLLISQGFLFVSFTTILNLVLNQKLSLYLIYIVAAIGIILNLFTFMGVVASFLHMADLVKFWKQPRQSKEDMVKTSRDNFPPLLGETKYLIFNGGFGPTLTPVVLGVTWVLLLIYAPI
jgi:hypothetical protein